MMFFFKRDLCRTSLIASRHLPAQRLRVRRQESQTSGRKAAGVKLRQYTGINRVRLDLRISNRTHLLRVRNDHLLHMWRNYLRGRLPRCR